MSISSDEVNYLVYRYLQENGFSHTAFSFAYESLITKSSVAQVDVPPGALITFLQKGLEYVGIEEHINEDGTVRDYDGNFSLLAPFICDAVAIKEERRQRKSTSSSSSSSTATGAPGAGSGAAAGAANGGASAGGKGNTDNAATTATPGKATNIPPAADIRLQRDSQGVKYLQLGGHQGEVFMCSWNPAAVTSKGKSKENSGAGNSDSSSVVPVPCLHQLATGSADGICRLWGLQDVADDVWSGGNAGSPAATAAGGGAIVQSSAHTISLHTGVLPHASFMGEKMKDVTSISWSPDGTHLATGCYDGLARIWNCNTGELKFLLKEHRESIFSVKWNKWTNQLLTVSHDRRAIVWDTVKGEIVRIFEGFHTAPILDVDWKDKDVFATCSTDGNICICSLQCRDTDVIRVFSGHTDEINAICWSPGGQYLASCSDDTSAKVWVLCDEGQELPAGVVDPSAASAGAMDEEGGKSRNRRNGYMKLNLLGHSKEIYTTRWTPTGPYSKNPEKDLYLCTASFDGSVKVWRMTDGSELYTLFSGNSAIGGGLGMMSTPGNTAQLPINPQPVYSVSASPGGDYLAIGSQGGFVSIWNMADGTLMIEERGEGDTFDVSWSFDGELLSACFASGLVNIMNVKNLLATGGAMREAAVAAAAAAEAAAASTDATGSKALNGHGVSASPTRVKRALEGEISDAAGGNGESMNVESGEGAKDSVAAAVVKEEKEIGSSAPGSAAELAAAGLAAIAAAATAPASDPAAAPPASSAMDEDAGEE